MMEPSRADFGHPYKPYEIQLQFMQGLYQCLEQGKVGIFESPTGTGKSLSLICGALTWLRDNTRRDFDQSFAAIDDDSDWLVAAENANRRRQFMQLREELDKKLATIREQEYAQRGKQNDAKLSKKLRTEDGTAKGKNDNDEEFMLDDYEAIQATLVHGPADGNLSSSTKALLDQLKPNSIKEQDEEESDCVKIIFCSRTHSQLTQFIDELRRVNVAPMLSQTSIDPPHASSNEVVKHLPLGSRKSLCINSKVSNLGSTTAINERCLELQKTKTPKDLRCKFLPTKESSDVLESFRDRAIAVIRDIEDIADLGRDLKVCPYYAARKAISPSEFLTLPYPLLLQKAARVALGVHVKGNIVIIDEAHNLMDAIADTMSISLSLNQLEVATRQTTFYVQRFKNRLKGQNRMYITQIIRLLNSLTDCLRSATSGALKNEVTVTAAQLMAGKGVDQIKPHDLLVYLQNSKLAYKVDGYAGAHGDNPDVKHSEGLLTHVQSFLAVVMNPDSEGRFFISKQDVDLVVKYTLLDPREHFRDIVEDARAVILAGGTMSPMSDYSNYLFSYLEPEKLRTFSFGHVVPKNNLLVETLTHDSSGIEFDFTFEKRNSEHMILALGKAILNICAIVPDGVVVFFPSYDYLANAVRIWRKNPPDQPVFEALEAVKRTFEEVRGSSVDELLRQYSQAIDTDKGGLMLSVIGGKLSEGINFSDRLGRAVIAVGLPFPNIHTAEWKAKIEHVEKLRYVSCTHQDLPEDQKRQLARLAGRDFYENACMRAINQSIGRAIRHLEDYAAIVLVDRRFATERIRGKLPQWIRSSMNNNVHAGSWTGIDGRIRRFFKQKVDNEI